MYKSTHTSFVFICLILLLGLIVCEQSQSAAAAPSENPDYTSVSEKIIPSRIVRIRKPGGVTHYLMGSVHKESIKDYIPNESLKELLFGCDRVFFERASSKQSEDEDISLLFLKKDDPDESSEKAEPEWLDIFLDKAKAYKENFTERPKLLKVFEGFIESYEKKREQAKDIPEDWGIASIFVKGVSGIGQTESEEKGEGEEGSKTDEELEDQIEDIFKKAGKPIGDLETKQQLILSMFEGQRFFTENSEKDINSLLAVIIYGMSKRLGLYEDSSEDEDVENVFQPNTTGAPEDFLDRGGLKRDGLFAESMLKAIQDKADQSSLFVVGVNHIPGILRAVSSRFEENGYEISFIRETDAAPGYYFDDIGFTGTTYEYRS